MKEKFSVLMSVYFKEKPEYLNLALESVFNQTTKPNEVVLIEDGKLTKELDDVIERYEKKYKKVLKVVKYEQNRGLGFALHDGILECTNEIVFRMDTDDICLPNRFEKQLKIFEKKNVDIVGGNIREFNEEMTEETSMRIVPESDEEIKKMLKKRNPLNHMTVAYRKSKVIEAGNYKDMLYFEDYYLWARMANIGCTFYNIQEILVNVRGGNDMIKRRGGKKYIKPILQFEKKIYNLRIVNIFEYMTNTLIRIILSLIPNNIRFLFYKRVLRK